MRLVVLFGVVSLATLAVSEINFSWSEPRISDASETGSISEASETGHIREKRQNYDAMSSSEIDQRRQHLEDQLRRLNQRRRHRYDKDRKCCEKSVEDDVDESPCCQRLVNQRCPYKEENRCGVPAPQYRAVTRKVTRIVTYTESPKAFEDRKLQLIAKLEEDLRQLRKTEDERLLKYEERRRLELEDELRRDQDGDEATLTENERTRRMALEAELSEFRRAELDRISRLSSDKRAALEAQLEAEKREEERKRTKREELLWRELDDLLRVEDARIGSIEQDRRQRLESELQDERQNTLFLLKKRSDERRLRLEAELKDQRQDDLFRLNGLEEQRRREFAEELRRLGLIANQRVVEDIEPYTELIPPAYNEQRQSCCYRCAGQNCGGGCPNDDDECPLKKKSCDKCRCNHAFVSCN